jgi:hypothetical protein
MTAGNALIRQGNRRKQGKSTWKRRAFDGLSKWEAAKRKMGWPVSPTWEEAVE